MPPPVLYLLAVVVAFGILLLREKLRRYSGLPPGPKGHWLLGNTLPKENIHTQFEKWIQEFGPVFTLRQGMKITVVVGRVDAAVEILDKQSSALNDRPVSIAMGQTLSGGLRILFSPNDDRFRKMRRALHAYLYPKAVTSYYPALKREVYQHMLDIIEDPTHYKNHINRYSTSVVLTTAYGQRATSYKDPLVVGIHRIFGVFRVNARQGAWKVDAFPFLRYLPGYLRPLQDAHKDELNLFRSQLDAVRQRKEVDEEVPDSLARYLIENEPLLGLSNDEMAYLAGSMFGAGSGSSSDAIGTAIAAAACFPAAQARVQEELDMVVGRERAPTLKDRDILPQTMAFMLETFRWRPAAPLGVYLPKPTDNYYKSLQVFSIGPQNPSAGNYQIPKGVTVIGSPWCIGRDPQAFSKPEDFDPQRFITGDGKLRDDFKLFTFGFARRVCPGIHLAQSSVFLNIAVLHWAFNIREDPDTPSNTKDRGTVAATFKPRIGSDFVAVRSILEAGL